MLAPDAVGNAIHRHRMADLREQAGEDGSLMVTAQRKHQVASTYLERPEHGEPKLGDGLRLWSRHGHRQWFGHPTLLVDPT